MEGSFFALIRGCISGDFLNQRRLRFWRGQSSHEEQILFPITIVGTVSDRKSFHRNTAITAINEKKASQSEIPTVGKLRSLNRLAAFLYSLILISLFQSFNKSSTAASSAVFIDFSMMLKTTFQESTFHVWSGRARRSIHLFIHVLSGKAQKSRRGTASSPALN